MAFSIFLLVAFSLSEEASAYWVNGYYRSNGTYVSGYYRSRSNAYTYDNYSYTGPTYSNGYGYNSSYYSGDSSSWYTPSYYDSRIEIAVDHPISIGSIFCFQSIGSKTSFLVLSLSLRYNFIDVRTYRQKEVKYHKRLASTAQIN